MPSAGDRHAFHPWNEDKMKRTVFALTTAVAALTFAGGAEAQGPLSVEVRGGFAFPTGSFADFEGGLSNAYTVGANARFQVTPMLGIYGGYSFTAFSRDAGGTGVDVAGPEGGVIASFAGGSLSPFVKGGVVYQTIDDQHGHELERNLGFEVGGGVEIPLGRTISFTPAVSYTSIPSNETDVSHVKADVGMRFRF